jgi:hypothetical protein
LAECLAFQMQRGVLQYIAGRSEINLPKLVPFHDRDIVVTACGRICTHRKKMHISIVLAGQMLAIKGVDDGVWLVSFMDYDLSYIEFEQRTSNLSTIRSVPGLLRVG